jgi:hypothetical protein
MPIQPIDMQTLFMRLNQVGKEQAVEREAAHLAQTTAAQELIREAEQHARSVTQTGELPDGLDSVKDEERKRREKERRGRLKDEKEDTEPNDNEVFRDPLLGSRIDIVG